MQQSRELNPWSQSQQVHIHQLKLHNEHLQAKLQQTIAKTGQIVMNVQWEKQQLIGQLRQANKKCIELEAALQMKMKKQQQLIKNPLRIRVISLQSQKQQALKSNTMNSSNSVEQLTRKIQQLKHSLNDKQFTIRELENRVNSQESLIELQKSRRLDNPRDFVPTEEINQVMNMVSELNLNVQQLKIIIGQKEKDIRILNQNLKSTKQQNEALIGKNEQLQKQNKLLKQQNYLSSKSSKHQAEALMAKNQQLLKQIRILRQHLNAKTRIENNAQSMMMHSDRTKIKNNQENKAFKSRSFTGDYEGSQKQSPIFRLKDADGHSVSTAKYSTHLQDHEEQNYQLRKETQILKKQFARKEKEVRNLQTLLAQKNAKIQQLRSKQIEQSKNQRKTETDQLNFSFHKEQVDKEQEVRNLKFMLSQIKQLCDKKQIKIKRLQQKNKDLQQSRQRKYNAQQSSANNNSNREDQMFKKQRKNIQDFAIQTLPQIQQKALIRNLQSLITSLKSKLLQKEQENSRLGQKIRQMDQLKSVIENLQHNAKRQQDIIKAFQQNKKLNQMKQSHTRQKSESFNSSAYLDKAFSQLKQDKDEHPQVSSFQIANNQREASKNLSPSKHILINPQHQKQKMKIFINEWKVKLQETINFYESKLAKIRAYVQQKQQQNALLRRNLTKGQAYQTANKSPNVRMDSYQEKLQLNRRRDKLNDLFKM